MRLSERTLTWAMRLYPPLLFQRIWVKRFEKGFYGVQVKIAKSLLNINYNRSIFGGTIFSAADPFYPVLLHEILTRKGYKTKIWVKSSSADFIKPALSNLHFSIQLTEADINEICLALNSVLKICKFFTIGIFDAQEKLCCSIQLEIYIRQIKED